MLKTAKNRIVHLLARALKQGWGVEEISRAAAWGVTVGIFPVYGVTTASLGAVGWIGRLNHGLLQGFNYLVGPVKLAMILPFVRLGELMWRANDPFRLGVTEFTARFQAEPLETLSRFSMTFVHAISGWLVAAPLVYLATGFLVKQSIRSGQAVRESFEEKHA